MKSRLETAGSCMSSLHLEMSTAGVYEQKERFSGGSLRREGQFRSKQRKKKKVRVNLSTRIKGNRLVSSRAHCGSLDNKLLAQDVAQDDAQETSRT